MLSDIRNDRMMQWSQVTGALTVFRAPSNDANGNTVDRHNRLLTCCPRCVDLCFGGLHRNEMLAAAHTSVYRRALRTPGVALD